MNNFFLQSNPQVYNISNISKIVSATLLSVWLLTLASLVVEFTIRNFYY